jgi:peptidoglycan/LPS O-acetylase OafA/YrhL
MLAAWATAKAPQKLTEKRWLPALASFVAVGALVGMFWLFRNHEWIAYDKCGTPLWQARWRLLIGVLVGLIAASGARSYRGVQMALGNPLLRFLGAISYNLYLWHKLITDELFRRRWPAPKTPDPHNDPAWQLSYLLVVIGLSVLVATVLTYGLEQPVLRWGKRRAAARAIE